MAQWLRVAMLASLLGSLYASGLDASAPARRPSASRLAGATGISPSSPEDKNLKPEGPWKRLRVPFDLQTSRIIRWFALGLHVWGYLAGHVASFTILSPALPITGKVPYTIHLPNRKGGS
mmetsp:Transcript_43241/g.136719  ORF Transcript_43241/g.136719 Transcript_43241/m.136719 type:complete len:120 (-) Transcript_43241:1149-1508(-)